MKNKKNIILKRKSVTCYSKNVVKPYKHSETTVTFTVTLV